LPAGAQVRVVAAEQQRGRSPLRAGEADGGPRAGCWPGRLSVLTRLPSGAGRGPAQAGRGGAELGEARADVTGEGRDGKMRGWVVRGGLLR
jgi:hypothetical protein